VDARGRGEVEIDKVAEKKKIHRQQYAALGKASLFFLTKYRPQDEVCLSAAVPEDRIVHITYHIPVLLEKIEIPDSGSGIAISVQEHMLEEDYLSMNDDDYSGGFMDDDYSSSMKSGSFPVETFRNFRKIGDSSQVALSGPSTSQN